VENLYDILIKSGKVITGAGNPWFRADLGVKDGRIARVGPLKDAEAEQVIDAEGLVISPGFVDMHNHSDLSVMINPRSESFIVAGNPVKDFFPVIGAIRDSIPFEEGIMSRFDFVLPFIMNEQKNKEIVGRMHLFGGDVRDEEFSILFAVAESEFEFTHLVSILYSDSFYFENILPKIYLSDARSSIFSGLFLK